MNSGRLNARDFATLGVTLMFIHYSVRAFDLMIEITATIPSGWFIRDVADELVGLALFGMVAWVLGTRTQSVAVRLINRDEESAALALVRLLTVGLATAGAILLVSRIQAIVAAIEPIVQTPPGGQSSFDERFVGNAIRLAGQVLVAAAGGLLLINCRSMAERFLRVDVAWEEDVPHEIV